MGAIFMGCLRNYGDASGVRPTLERHLARVSLWKSPDGLRFIGSTEGRVLRSSAEDLKKDLAKISVVEFFSWFNEY